MLHGGLAAGGLYAIEGDTGAHLVKPVDLTTLNALLGELPGGGVTPPPEPSRRGATRRRDTDRAREP